MKRLTSTDYLPHAGDFDFAEALPCPSGERAEELASTERIAKARGLIALLVASVPEEYRWAAETPSADFSTKLAEIAPHVMPCLAQVLGAPQAAAMVFLHGRSGTGKSVLGTARARLLAEHGERVLFVQALDLGAESRATEWGKRCELLERAKRFSGLVVLDDLGKDLKYGPASAAAVADVVATRHSRGRKLLVTTGLNQDQVRAGYDAGNLRRMTERGRATVIRLGPPDIDEAASR